MAQHYQAPTVKKAFQILEQVCRSEAGINISDLSRNLAISKSTVHGITAALVDSGALVRDPATKRYRPGPALLRLGRAATGRFDVTATARPHMVKLRDRVEESVFLGVVNGADVTILDIVESTRDLKITAPVGTRIPLLAGATGKVLLASMDDEHARELLCRRGLHRYTDNSIVDEQRYLDVLATVRINGFATDDEEYLSGVRAVATRVQIPDGPSSAIWVVGFTSSIDGAKMGLIAREITSAARSIEAHAS
jgi:DNA-binding IclR family transcriptional regulator